MEILFRSARLHKTLGSERELTRRYGRNGARRIGARLAQLEAADTLEDMRYLPGRCHELGEDRQGQLAVDVEQPRRLVFEPSGDPSPKKKDGGLDWTKVISITIIEIVDYH